MSRNIFSSLIMSGLIAICGCSLWSQTQEANYQTIQADPRHDTEEAFEQHEKALKIIDRYVEGKCLHSDLDKAEEHLQKSLTADITYGPAHNTLGMLYLWQHKLYLAAWEYEYAIKVMPHQIEPVYNLALVYEEARKLDQAIMYMEQAYGMDPKDPRVTGSLAKLKLKNGDSLESVRPLIKELLFYESRPEWIEWAEDMLGEHPEKDYCAIDEEQSPDEEENAESLPLLVPPKPPEPLDSYDESIDTDPFSVPKQSWKPSDPSAEPGDFQVPVNLPSPE